MWGDHVRTADANQLSHFDMRVWICPLLNLES